MYYHNIFCSCILEASDAHLDIKCKLWYYLICASVREDNPRALASGLSSVQTHKPYDNFGIA